ncbi:MAG: hypothetical protein L3J28_01740 [Candidatus Polarisedimenticolaceae bacterium]|nr:hypothetical protein [Candidatus Polarisedimenticolaceae bacterium]
MNKNAYLAFMLLFTFITFGLVGCGGGDSGGVAGDGSAPAGPVLPDRAAHSIKYSWSITNAIENLGAGLYRRVGTVKVEDIDGGAVSDGTVVNLNIIDSIIATGVITAAGGDSIVGPVLTDMAPTQGDWATALPQFDAAEITRNSAQRDILPGDSVLLFNADEEDKIRTIGTTVLSNNTLTVSSAFSGIYPNATYGNAQYVVGASLLGAEIAGEDSDGNLTTGKAYTVNGFATFKITYPANINTINVGCGNVPAVDARYAPLGSADVHVFSSVNSSVTTVSTDFCFSPISGGTIELIPTVIASTSPISLRVRDGGDTIPVPYTGVSVSVVYKTNTGGLSVTPDAGSYTTNAYGFATPTLTVAGGASSDEATVTFIANGTAVGVVTVEIP